MAFEIRYINGGEGIECLISGRAHTRELVKINEEIYSDPHLTRQKYQIVDLTDLESVEVNDRDIIQIAEMDKAAAKANPDIVIAVVAPGDLEYGLSRIWRALVDDSGFETRIFRDRESADRWIEELLSGRE